MNDPILSKLHPFPTLKVESVKHRAFEQKNPIEKPLPILMPKALLGIEIEVENITSYTQLPYYWKSKEDGSLRNYGAEFVSIPLRAYQVEHALDHLNANINAFNKPDFSPRTSVHIHMNVRDMSWDQIKTLILLYAIFERHFFHIAGTKRETSVFCVPLYKTEALRQFDVIEIGMQWHKYTAINLGTILGNGDVPNFGTIEFRHLYGTLDKNIIINWINNILCLRKAVINLPFEQLVAKIKDLNTSSEYYALYKETFGEYALTDLMTKKDFEHCVTTTKKVLWGNHWNWCLDFKRGSAYDTYVQKKQAEHNRIVELEIQKIQETKKKPSIKEYIMTTPIKPMDDVIANWFENNPPKLVDQNF